MKSIERASLGEWLECNLQYAIKQYLNTQTYALIPYVEVEKRRPYHKKHLELAKQNLKEKFAFVGIQEYFDLSLDLFSATFALNSIDATNYTTNLNTKKTKDTKYDLDEEVLAIVREKNKMDLELYEYAKELFFERLHKINKSVLWQNRIQTFETISNIKDSCVQHFSIEAVYSTHGFYAIENELNKSFKWSGYQTPSIIEFLYKFKKNKLYKIEIELVNIIDKSILPSVKIILDDIVLKHKFQKKLLKRRNNTIVCEISSSDIDCYKNLHFIKIFSDLKKEGSYKGARNLGLAICYIEIKEI